jgi:hypothetical protein
VREFFEIFCHHAVSMIALALMCLLFFSELSWFMTTETSNHLRVDPSRGEKLKINFDVTFPHISCSRTANIYAICIARLENVLFLVRASPIPALSAILHTVLTIDVMDVSGSHQEDVEHTVLKKRIDSHGNLIGIPMKEGACCGAVSLDCTSHELTSLIQVGSCSLWQRLAMTRPSAMRPQANQRPRRQ